TLVGQDVQKSRGPTSPRGSTGQYWPAGPDPDRRPAWSVEKYPCPATARYAAPNLPGWLPIRAWVNLPPGNISCNGYFPRSKRKRSAPMEDDAQDSSSHRKTVRSHRWGSAS